MKAVQKEQIDLTKQQIAEQQRLAAEAKAMAEFDKAKAAWEKKNQEALKTKLQLKILETAELKKQEVITRAATKAEQANLRLKQQQLSFEKQSAYIAEKKLADELKASERLKQEKLIEEERVRRIAAQQKVLGAVNQTGQLSVTPYTNNEIIQSRAALSEEKQRLALMEAELRVQGTQAGVKRVDLELAEKQIAEERAKLGLQEVQITRSEQLLRLQKEQERIQASTVDAAAVAKIKQRVGYSPYTAPKIGGLLGVGGLLGESTSSAVEEVYKEKEKLSIMQAELRVMAQEEEYRKVDIASVSTAISKERERLELLSMQLREQKEQSIAGKLTGFAKETASGIGNTLQRLTGGGVLGSIIVGGISIELINKLVEKVGELKADLVGAVGPAQQLRVEFERLAERKGISGEDMLKDLRANTRGLVADLDLYKTANTFLRSGMKLTEEQMSKLVGTTVELARATGHTAPEAMRALEQYFITGYARSIGRVTGINRQELAVRGLSNTLSPLDKKTVEFVNLQFQEEQMFLRVGKAATTVPEILQQVTVAQQNFIEGIAKGITNSNSFNEAIQRMSQLLISLGPKLEDIAVKVGTHLGNAVKWVADNFNTLKHVVEGLIAVKVGIWAIKQGIELEKLGSKVVQLAYKYGILKLAKESLDTPTKGIRAGEGIAEGVGVGVAEGVGEGAGVGVGVGVAEGVGGGVAAAGLLASLPVVIAIGAALGYIALVAKTVGLTFSDIVPAARELETEIKEKLTAAWDIVSKKSISYWSDLKNAAKPVIDYLSDSIGLNIVSAWEKVEQAGGKAWDYIKEHAVDALKNTPEGFIARQIKALSEKDKLRPPDVSSLPSLSDNRRTPWNALLVKPKSKEEEEKQDAWFAAQKKIAEQTSQLHQLMNKSILDALKQRISAEDQALKDQYDEGIISLREYAAKEKAIKTEESDAEIKKLRSDLEEKLKAVKVGESIEIDGKPYQTGNAESAELAKKILREREADAEIAIETRKNTQLHSINRQLISDEEAAYRVYIETINKIELDGVKERTTILETEFKQGNVGAQTYIEDRKSLIKEELDLTLSGLSAKKDANKNNAIELANIAKEEGLARLAAIKQTNQLELQEADIQVQALQNHYDKAKRFLETQYTIAKGSVDIDSSQKAYAIDTQLLSLTDQFIEKQIQQLNVVGQTQAYYTKIYESISQATLEQQKLNQQLAQAKDLSGPLSNVFGQIAGLVGEFRNTSGAVSVLNNLSKSLENISKFTVYNNLRKAQSNKVPGLNVAKSAQQIFDEALGKSASTVDMLDSVYRDTAKEVKYFGDALETVRKQLLQDQASQAVPLTNIPLQSAQDNTDFPTYDSSQGFDNAFPWKNFQVGGIVTETGPAWLHKNEEVINAPQVGMLSKMVEKLTQEISKLTGSLVKVLNKIDNSNKPTSTLNDSVGGLKGFEVQGTEVNYKNKSSNDNDNSALSQLKAPVKALATSFMNLFHSTDKLTGAQVPFAARLQDFTKNLSGWIAGIQGVIQGVTGGKNAAGGALSGGMAGMQLGSNFGPIGAAAGAVGGAALGAIFGNKQARLTSDLKKVQDQMQSIIDSMNAGTISLAQTIADLRRERQQALTMLSGDKKGSKSKKGQPSQVQQAIQAIDSEIAKLVEQQTQILQNLTSSLITLSQPLQFQDYLNSLDQIIQKYQEFASAAQGNAQEMGQANQFLTLSLQNYVTTLSQQLNQAQQTAIQDALTLINLEYQRQQLINQTAQQEYDILTQGVLARQRTTAMTKGQEIGQLRYQRDMQLQQMDEEIAINQAKVDAESKIFGLATTRIGLEQQLLQAQKEQADYQIAQVLALSQVVSALTSGLSSGQIMSQLQAMYAGGSMPTGSGLLLLLAQLLGLDVPAGDTGGQYGTQNWLTQVPQQWQDAAQYVSQQNPNFYKDFEAAAGSSPGSPSRTAAVDDVQPLVAQGKVEGYDMQGFLNWLETGNIPVLEKGGPIERTGLIYGHEGEHVLNAPTVEKLKTIGGVDNVIAMVTGFADSLGSVFKGVGNTATGKSMIISQTATAQPSPAMPSVANDLSSTMALQAHGAMLSMAQQRSSIEYNILSAKQAHLSAEMNYLSALNDTLSNIQNTEFGAGSTSLEGLFQKVYETRGRQGAGNFRREIL
jgi:hypothetical protein